MLHVSNLSISPVIFRSLADFSDVSDESEDAIEWSEVESEEEEEDTDIDESAEEMEESETTSAEQGENSDSDTGTDDSPLEKGSLKNAGCGTADVFGATGSDDAGFNGEFPSARRLRVERNGLSGRAERQGDCSSRNGGTRQISGSHDV